MVQDKMQGADITHFGAGCDQWTDHGSHLYQEGCGRQIILARGWCTLHNEYRGQRWKQFAFEQGIALEAIVMEDSQVTSAYSEDVDWKRALLKAIYPPNQ